MSWIGGRAGLLDDVADELQPCEGFSDQSRFRVGTEGGEHEDLVGGREQVARIGGKVERDAARSIERAVHVAIHATVAGANHSHVRLRAWPVRRGRVPSAAAPSLRPRPRPS